MAIDHIQLPQMPHGDDGSGKKTATFSVTQGEDTVHVSRVIVEDEAGDRVTIDHTVHALVKIDAPHHEVHEGEMFVATDVATFNGTRDILITTGIKEPHITMDLVCDGALNVTVYRNAVATESANAIPAINCNHNSTTVSLTTLCFTPTAITTGSDIVDRYFNGGSGGKVGGTDRGTSERILAPSAKYLVRLVTVANVTVLTRIHFYEEPHEV